MSETTTTETAEARETVYVEGYGLVDADTGELVEMEDVPSTLYEDEPAFSEQDVEWALKKLFALDGEIVASEGRMKAEIAAITSNLKPKVNRLKGAKESFKNWVAAPLEAYARAALAKSNLKKDGTVKANPEKSVKSTFGVLAFTAVNKVGIAGPEGGVAETRSAVEWMKANFPGGVDYEPRLSLDALDADEREAIRAVIAGEQDWEAAGWSGPCPLRVTLPGDRFDFRTGVR